MELSLSTDAPPATQISQATEDLLKQFLESLAADFGKGAGLPDDDEWDDEDATAARLRLQPKTLANQRSNGEGPPYSKVGRSILYRRGDVRAWLKARRAETVWRTK